MPSYPQRFVHAALLGLLALFIAKAPTQAANWPGWRGDGTGISREKSLPVSWSATRNVAWKAALPGEGASSPIVWGNRVFVTAAQENGRKRLVLCLDAANGRILWQRELAGEPTRTDPKTGHAAPTPVTDGERLYAFFDSPGLVALDMSGNVLWTRPLGPFTGPWGFASSPILYKDLVILNCDHNAGSFLVAVDRATGAIRWKTPRKMLVQFATPLLIRHNGTDQLIVNGITVYAYDPQSGRELWWCRGMIKEATPTAVYSGGLVYVTTGRNGPAMGIDPSGRGDVSETRVRMHVTTGGPLIPSPLALPILALPRDDGTLRFLDPSGKIVLEQKAPGHYSASPVAGDNKLYWSTERGETSVLDISGLGARPRSVRLLAVNRIGERCLASPAIAGGRLFLRGERNLYCIARGSDQGTPAQPGPPPASLAELKERWEHPGGSRDEQVLARLEVVEALGQAKTPGGIPLLLTAAQQRVSFDVAEAAVRALGEYGPEAAPAFITLLDHFQPFIKIVSAEGLGRLQSQPATPALLKTAKDADRDVRIAALGALTQIAKAHAEEAPAIAPALVAGLNDPEGVVREAAITALAQVPDQLGERRPTVVSELIRLTADRNPLVAGKAAEALVKAYGMPAGIVKHDRLLYGAVRRPSVIYTLRAGPIRLKFQDGELRYLYAGNREIARRLYFAVRDGQWDTVMPEFTRIAVKKEPDRFRIEMDAVCRAEGLEYRWNGEITGTPEGKITFHASGEAGSNFRSARIGLCVLYGAPALAGQRFEAAADDGSVTSGEFPRLISPQLLATRFRALSYAVSGGPRVNCSLEGALFDMEDQRNFGDTSYKAYAPLPYSYPGIGRGERLSETLTLAVSGAASGAPAAAPIRVRLGGALAGARLPKLLPLDPAQREQSFAALNGRRQAPAGTTTLAWAFNPAAHLPDDDTFMENAPGVIDQVRTVRSFAPKARIRVAPISFDALHPRPNPDPRAGALFGAAWSAAVLRGLALAGADEAAFAAGTGPAQAVLARLAQFTGRSVLQANVVGPLPRPVEALAVAVNSGRVVWLINTTDQAREVLLEGLARGTVPLVERLTSTGRARGIAPNGGVMRIVLGPYEVCQVALTSPSARSGR